MDGHDLERCPIRHTAQPNYGRTASGYGSKIPTRYQVELLGRWRRVYVMQYGNAGSAYVVYQGRRVFLRDIFHGDTVAYPVLHSVWTPEI